MSNRVVALICAAALAALAGCAEDTGSTAAPDSGAEDLSDFVGARAGQAEMGLQARGYELIRSEGLTSYWFNREAGACAEITTSNGVYSSINMLPVGNC